MKKVYLRFIALLLTMVLSVSVSTVPVGATDTGNVLDGTGTVEKAQNTEEGQDPQFAEASGDVENKGTNSNLLQNESSEPSEEDKGEGLLNYIYVESPYLETPNEQNIVVSWGDGTQNITDMKLSYQKSDGSSGEFLLTEKTGELYLFKTAFSEEDSGVYQIAQITYVYNGEEKTLDLLSIGAGAQFGVDMPYSEEKAEDGISVQSEDVEMSVVTLDGHETSVEAAESIEGTIKETAAVAAGSGARSRARKSTRAASEPLVVVLDPGHGGTDSGAVGHGLKEKDLTLKIATYCKEELEKYRNVKVYMTRTGDTTEKSLERRVQIAVDYGADVLVSIHINSAVSADANGAEVWYPHAGYNYEVHQEGANLAQQIQKQLVALGLYDRKIKVRYGDDVYPDGSTTDYYGIIRNCKNKGIPGIIVEHAFISNSSDVTNFLGNENGLKKLGIADATGIANAYGLRKKSEADIEISNVNDFNGTFDLKVDTSLPEISRVTASVWRDEERGNKKEYNMQLQEDGTYLCKVQKSDFSGKTGKYSAKATIYYKNGTKETETVTYTLIDSKADVTVSPATDEKTVEVTVSISNPPSSLTGLRVAVWGNVNGGNDLRWYGLSKDAQGKWKAIIPISNHKEVGEYFADLYANFSNGNGICINSSKFKISEPELETIIEKYDENSGTFEIIARNIKSPSGIKAVRFPVWNDADSSTMFWYDAQKQKDGSYKAVVDVKNHKFSKGTYRAHVYITMGNDITVSKNVGTCEVAATPKLNIEIKDTSGNEKTFQAIAKNLETFGDIKQVRYAVWSRVGKGNDLKWYDASKDSQGAWKANIAVSNHKQAGEYFVDTYIILKNGKSMWVNTSYFTVTDPTLDIEFGKYDEKSGTFEIVARNIQSVSGVKQVRFPVWSKDDSSTVYWYEGVKQTDGSYKAKVNVKNHKFNKGTYLAHVYVTMGNDVTVSKNAGTCEVTMPKANIEVKDISGIEKTYQAVGRNLGIFGSIRQVRYAVWSVVGKGADLKWYNASDDGQGAWKTNISIKDHGQTGKYIMDTYVTLTNGVSICVNTSYFTVTDPTLEIEFGNYNESNGAFEIIARNIQSVSGVERVRFPVWYKADSSAMYWYEGVKQSDGSYKAIGNVKNHKYAKGTYLAHVYVTMGNGITVSKNAGSCEITMPKVNVEFRDNSGTQKVFQAIGKNLEVLGSIKGVRFAVWSKAGKGADLKWYNGSKDSQGVWKADIAINNHKQAGEYIVDTYVTLTSGISICADSNTSAFVVTTPTMDVEIGEYNEDRGTFEIIARNVTSPSGVKYVRFPVWNEADSSTVYWYEGERQSDGSYKALANVRNHKSGKGTYIVHGYIYAENGVIVSLLAGKQEVDKVIIKELYSIMGKSTVTIDQMVKQFSLHNSVYPKEELGKGKAENIVEFCTIAFQEAEAEGVKAEVLFAQMMLETNYLRFGGDVKISQFNFGGLGATGGGVEGNKFPDVRTGIRAQVQHLKCYASDEPLNQDRVDQRWFDSLRLKAPYVEWLGIPDNPYGTGWAATKGYGDRLLNIIDQMKK